MNLPAFPSWFFEDAKPRIPVRVTRFLPYNATNQAGEPIGAVHWKLIDGTLFMSQEALDRTLAAGKRLKPPGRL